MNDTIKSCDLCQLPVEVSGYQLNTLAGVKYFCCEGCQGIYRMLHEGELTKEHSDNSPET